LGIFTCNRSTKFLENKSWYGLALPRWEALRKKGKELIRVPTLVCAPILVCWDEFHPFKG
jgi:hypothetical protein